LPENFQKASAAIVLYTKHQIYSCD